MFKTAEDEAIDYTMTMDATRIGDLKTFKSDGSHPFNKNDKSYVCMAVEWRG
jgi:hypothetical protein